MARLVRGDLGLMLSSACPPIVGPGKNVIPVLRARSPDNEKRVVLIGVVTVRRKSKLERATVDRSDREEVFTLCNEESG